FRGSLAGRQDWDETYVSFSVGAFPAVGKTPASPGLGRRVIGRGRALSRWFPAARRGESARFIGFSFIGGRWGRYVRLLSGGGRSRRGCSPTRRSRRGGSC